MTVVVDSGVLIGAFLPDERFTSEAQFLTDAQSDGRVELVAPSLLPYDCANAALKAVRQQRIDADFAQRMLTQIELLGVGPVPVDPVLALKYALQFGRSAYDASYLALAEQEGVPLVTADERLYNSVRGALPWVVWLPEWRERIDAEAPTGTQGAEDE
jgi:predicted nucleic acid-binding protein